MIHLLFENVVSTKIIREEASNDEYNYIAKIETTEGEIHIVRMIPEGTINVVTVPE